MAGPYLPLRSIVLFIVTLVYAETSKEETYEDLIYSSMESVVALNEVVSNFEVQLAEISTSLSEMRLKLQQVKTSVSSLEQNIVDLEVEGTSVSDDEVSELTSSLASTSAKIAFFWNEVMIVSGEGPAGNYWCSKVCAGSTGRDNTDWTDYHNYGVYNDVDISDCGFLTIPTITTAIEGIGWHWTSTGTSSIYFSSPTSFRIYIEHTGRNPQGGVAESLKWNVEWIAVGYTC